MCWKKLLIIGLIVFAAGVAVGVWLKSENRV